MQRITLEVKIPDEYVIIKQIELEELQQKNDERVWIGFKDLEKLTDLGRDKLDTILKRYRDELDVYNGGPVKYPDGGRWNFEKDGIRKWLKDNHSRIWIENQALNK